MIYLNQAATTYPKPETVKEAVKAAIALPPFSQNRTFSAEHQEDISEKCRQRLAKLFHIENRDRIYFTSGATDSFNRIVRGLDLEGQRVIATANEHNAVLRPLYNLYDHLQIDIADIDSEGNLLYEQLEKMLQKSAKAVFVNQCSNVIGKTVDLETISEMAHRAGALVVADVSQSAGHMEVDAEKMGIDILVFTGHKGLFGPQGTGGYYVNPNIRLKQTVFGGTGYDSKRLVMDEDSAEYEVGTQNLHGLAGLCAGVDFVLQQGVQTIQKKEQELLEILRRELGGMKHITVYGGSVSADKASEKESSRKDACGGSVLSFNVRGLSPSDVGYILANSYDIIVRSGFHCAPLVHSALGTDEKGTVRVSVSCFNTVEDIEKLIAAVRELG